MTRSEAFKMHKCMGCVLYNTKLKECKQLDLPLSDKPLDLCPVPDSLHKEWQKAVSERRLR